MDILIKNFEKAKKIYEIIKVLDSDIIKIEKLAIQLSNDHCKVYLEMEVANLSNQNKEKESIFDEDGSLKSDSGFKRPTGGLFSFIMSDMMSDMVKKNSSTMAKESLSLNLNESESLCILDTIMRVKVAQRESLIKQLNSYGVRI
jgi:hypothetical protein